ncbi:hypothetical protein ACIP4U_27485 [Streptomyces caelestis]|uniref:hypothetical protein n=1 Tax=Streptomyces caelestis TaxID=36816 RepID=UPI001C886210
MGTLLSLVNQGAVIAAGGATAATWWRMLFNYLVPCCRARASSAAAVGRPGSR